MWSRRLLPAACSGTALIFVVSAARGDMTKEQCVQANADGQARRLNGEFAAARAQFGACGDPSCPAIVRDDCAQRMNELDRVQPTIVFDVKDASGADVSAVSVAVDGVPLVDKLGGLALRVDPGEHSFTFTAAGRPPVARRFVLREGEKDRHERIVIDATATTPVVALAPTSASAAPVADSTPRAMSTQKILGLAAGGVGLAGIAVGGVFGLLTFSRVSQQKTDCATASCSASGYAQALSDHSSAETNATISTVAFLAGGALLLGGAALYFTAPSASATRSTAVRVVPSVGPGGGAAFVCGEF